MIAGTSYELECFATVIIDNYQHRKGDQYKTGSCLWHDFTVHLNLDIGTQSKTIMSQSPTRSLPTLSLDAAKIAAEAAEAKAKHMGIGTHPSLEHVPYP